MPAHTPPVRAVQWAMRMLALGLAGLHAWVAANRHSMNADGIAYLDIGDAFARGDWAHAVNPVWSPLYPIVLGFVNRLVQPPMEWEFGLVHFVNLCIFAGSMVSFEYLWRGLRTSRSGGTPAPNHAVPEWAWWTIGYALFTWVGLCLIQIWAVTPDMLMAAWVFLAAGLIARLRGGTLRSRMAFVVLGLVLGLGYLTKAVMFPIALVFVLVTAVAVRPRSRAFGGAFLSFVVFLLVALPLVHLISQQKGRLTIGEGGRITVLRHVVGVPFPHWQGDAALGLALTHPSREILSNPPVYEFAEPIGGTYPISTDPSYWYEGVTFPFDLRGQLERLFASAVVYLDLFVRQQGVLVACVIAMYLISPRERPGVANAMRRWALMLPALAAFALYGWILVQSRYIGVFVLLLWADLLANVRVPGTASNRMWLNVLCLVATGGLLTSLLLFNLEGAARVNPTLAGTPYRSVAARAPGPVEVARALRAIGVSPGAHVGIIGYGYDAFWARLAKVKIVAEMLESDAGPFWSGDTDVRHRVLRAFAEAGVRVIIAEHVPTNTPMTGWTQVGETRHYIYPFQGAGQAR